MSTRVNGSIYNDDAERKVFPYFAFDASQQIQTKHKRLIECGKVKGKARSQSYKIIFCLKNNKLVCKLLTNLDQGWADPAH